jgi:Tfp pilus assembly protein PilN
MALHINLYHEIQKQRALQRRDPLKLSIYGLAAIGAALAGYYFLQLGKLHSVKSELAVIQAEFNALQPQTKAAKEREDELSSKVRSSELLVKRIENRFYWAPLLEQLMQSVPKDVQLTKLSADISGEGLRKCSMTIDGLSAGTDPRKVAEELRTSITEKFGPKYKEVRATFKSLEDATELAMLDGQQVPTATFAINVNLTTGEAAAPPAAPRKTK